jgi:hypothetical protein
MKERILLGLSLCVVLTGCAGTLTRSDPGQGQRVQGMGPYTLVLPQGDTLTRLPAVDQQIGEWRGPGLRLVFVYGPYAGLPDEGAATDVKRGHLVVDGHRGEWIGFRPAPGQPGQASHVWGVLFRSVDSATGSGLEVTAECGEPHRCELGRQIVGTIRFATTNRS